LNGYSGAQYALLEWLDGCWQVELHAIKYDTARIRSDFLRKSLLEEGGPLARCSLNSIESGEDSSLNLLRYAWRLAKQVGRQIIKTLPVFQIKYRKKQKIRTIGIYSSQNNKQWYACL
jgi:hypothetical protein